ncbi:MAG: hypothetical protein EAZ92_15000 [Candidatus Kapaibacterium sp.]|nr:MAG: hypothetical protein EAZ92_15000 [Candidatus Kapabacteria bacterium]
MLRKPAYILILLTLWFALPLSAPAQPLKAFFDAGTWGYKNKAGKVVIKPTFQLAKDFVGSRGLVRFENKFGYIDPQGKIAIPCKYDDAYSFVADVAWVKLGQEFMLIDTKGKVLQSGFDDMKYTLYGSFAQVKRGSKYGLFDAKGNVCMELKYDNISLLNDNQANTTINGRAVVIYDLRQHQKQIQEQMAAAALPALPALPQYDYRDIIKHLPLIRTKYPNAVDSSEAFGKISIRVLVDSTGKPLRVEADKKEDKVLSAAAINACKSATYTPATDKKPTWLNLPVFFLPGIKEITEPITPLELEVMYELNLARMNPPKYADKLAEIKKYIKGNILQLPNDAAAGYSSTFIATLNEAIAELRATTPRDFLAISPPLLAASRVHMQDCDAKGIFGHEGSDGSMPQDRMQRFAKWENAAGENVSYGTRTAFGIISQLLIDDGVPSRGHRKNILHSSYNFVGVSYGNHAKYNHQCVQNFAGFVEPLR